MKYRNGARGPNPSESKQLRSYQVINISHQAHHRVLAHSVRTQQSMKEAASELILLGGIASGVPSNLPEISEE